MTRVVIYARVSSEEQAGPDKSSISTQLDDCRALAAKLGWSIVGEFIDDKRYRVGKKLVEPSGTRADRPQWRRMLETLSAGRADALIAWHSSRLYRAYRPMVDFLELLDTHPVQVQLVKDSFDPRFAVLQAWLGREENKARVERTRFGHMGRAKKGLVPTRISPFFKRITEPATGETLGFEFDERHRALFDHLARLCLARLSYREIARRLGRHPLTGQRWNDGSVSAILHNQSFRGVIAYGRRSKGAIVFEVPARHRPVWDAVTCQAIAAELERRARMGHHVPHGPPAPFAGVVCCGYCGIPMRVSPMPRRQKDGRPYRQYACRINRQIQLGDRAGVAHAPNTIAEQKLLRLARELADALSGVGVEETLAILAGAVPAGRVDDSEVRRQLADLQGQIAEMEPDLGRVRGLAARAAIESELSGLRAQAADLEQHLQASVAAPSIDLAALRAGWEEYAADPNVWQRPDPELRAWIVKSFPVIYVAGGQISRPPD